MVIARQSSLGRETCKEETQTWQAWDMEQTALALSNSPTPWLLLQMQERDGRSVALNIRWTNGDTYIIHIQYNLLLPCHFNCAPLSQIIYTFTANTKLQTNTPSPQTQSPKPSCSETSVRHASSTFCAFFKPSRTKP